ncbi:MAG TPA: AI-2E family transporter [Bacteroidales bacterium]|nr:AI-2E family transporter [Bacteroidales bacterium]
MKDLYQKYRLFFLIIFLLAIGFLVWYFFPILVLVLIAGVISIIGSPLVNLLDRIHIGKVKFPHVLSVTLTLLLIIAVIIALFSFFIPLVFAEAQLISSIDTQKLEQYYHPQIQWLQDNLIRYGIIQRSDTVESLFLDNFSRIVDFGLFSTILTRLISFTGSFFFHTFSIIFLSFFFLYDSKMLPRFILKLVNEKYREQTQNVMDKSKKLLTRYFTGLFFQVLANIATYAIALTIIGVKGALVIAFFAGIIIIIPYLGGVIAVITGILLGVTGVISAGDYAHVLPMAISILVAMLIVQVIDNNVFQPYIQGKSVRAHPVEIFLVVIAAASIGGIPAMIVAVPAYAFLRIVASEFLSQFRLIRDLNS